MPIYEFRCNACGKIFETLVFNSDEQTYLECPSCKGQDIERVLSSFSKCGPGASATSSCKPAGSKFG